MKNFKKFAVILIAACSVFLISCDESSSGGYEDTEDYDYYDAAGNGYNDEDVDWDNDGNGGIGWDQAVGDWNREHGIY